MSKQQKSNEQVSRAMAALLEEVLKSGNDAIAERALELDKTLGSRR